MKTRNLFGILMLFLCAFSFIGCDDDDDFSPFPEGTSSLRMMNEGNGKVTLGNSDVYITNEGNFKSNNFPIFDMGGKKGVGDIDMPDFVNMAPEVAVQPKHGYVTCSPDDIHTFDSRKKAIRENANVYRAFVDSWIKDKDENVTGANVYFLLGNPLSNKKEQMPAWESSIGTLEWNYDMGKSNTLNIALPASSSNDIEVEFITKEGKDYISYSLNKNTISFELIGVNAWEEYYKLRIRCKHVYTEVTIANIN